MEIGWGIATVWMGLALLASFSTSRFNERCPSRDSHEPVADRHDRAK